jgi:Mg2+ and Co2+ transporter CorA
MAWFDTGRHLDDTDNGPWRESQSHQRDSTDRFVPTVQHISYFGQASNNYRPVKDLSSSSSPSSSLLGVLDYQQQSCQSAQWLPSQYGSTLDRNVMALDGFYAFSELFAFAASSENQFINFMRTQVNEAVSAFKGQETFCLDALRYSNTLLDEHVEDLEGVIAFLEHQQESSLPKSKDPEGLAQRSRDILLNDFQSLLRQTKSIAARSIEGMSIISKYTSLDESEKAMNLQQDLGRVTVLAFFFVPLSFVTSIFGMNFVQFQGWKLALGFFVLMFIIVTVISTILCFWDKIPWSRAMEDWDIRLYQFCRVELDRIKTFYRRGTGRAFS